jgi:DNA repair protein RecO (recombination protein O)
MGLVETQAIVLNTYKLAEADKIALCLTEKAGLVRGVAHGARRLKSRFGASLEPFTLIQLTYFEKESRELVTIKSADILRSYFSLAQNADAFAALEYLTGLVREFALPHQPDERLFRMVRACVDALAAEPTHYRAVFAYCELWLLKLGGFLPDMRVCGGCGKDLFGESGSAVYISPEGILWCESCQLSTYPALSAEVYGQISALRVLDPSRWSKEFQGLMLKSQEAVADVARRLVRRALEKDPRKGRLTTVLPTL